jgi:hypothetical protein
MPGLISSKLLWPTSLMNIRRRRGVNANVNGLRRPIAQMLRLSPSPG